MSKFIIAVFVENKSGVLTRVTSMFTRRGFNIDALTVGETESPEYSRITISLSGDGYAREQLINQMKKLYNVKKVEVLEETESIKRELMLLKVKNESSSRSDILSAVDVFRAKVIDVAKTSLTLEVFGSKSKISALIEMLADFGILEIAKTGTIAIERGRSTIYDDNKLKEEYNYGKNVL
jgi:acetolactate synthase-1/3 small subunit